MSNTAPTLQRGAATWMAYVLLMLFSFIQSLIGPLLPHIRAELNLDYSVAALHTTVMALGIIGVGMVGDRIVTWIGRPGTVWLGVAGLIVGNACYVAAPNVVVSIFGCFLVGALGMLIVLVAPAVLSDLHGAGRGIAFAEANVLANLGALSAPLVIWAVVAGGSWRMAAVVAWVAVAITFVLFSRVPLPPARVVAAGASARLPGAYWSFWAMLGSGVAAEFCMAVWSPSYFEAAVGLDRPTALLAAAGYPAGMTLGRLAGSLIVRRVDYQHMVLPSLAVAAAGFALFWTPAMPVLSVAGLFITGLGIANCYPASLTLALASAGTVTDVATARAALAAGLAILAAPLLVGGLADRFGIGWAYAVVPALLIAAAASFAFGMRMRAATA